jgi:PhnB protein
VDVLALGEASMSESKYEGYDLRAVRPYLIVGDANAAIAFYERVFDAEEIERFRTPTGGVAHVKLRIGETIVELGEHPSALTRGTERPPRIGLRLYVADADSTFARAIAAGATGDAPSNRLTGVRSATVYDPFGLTWWVAARTK